MENERLIRHVRKAIIEATTPLLMDSFVNMHITPVIQKAMDLDTFIVIGDLGSGKTLLAHWLNRCRDDGRLAYVKDTRLKKTTIYYAWTNHVQAPWMPKSSQMVRLCKKFDPHLVWKTIIYEIISAGTTSGFCEWNEKVKWVSKNPEQVARALEATNKRLSSDYRHLLLLFDDADEVPGGSESVKGILKNLLYIQGFQNIHGKMLATTRVFEDPNTTAFNDASKILATKVNLTWTLADLHKALWHRLVNLEGVYGYLMRDIYTNRVNHKISYTRSDVNTLNSIWSIDVPEMDIEAQCQLFDDLAGRGAYHLIETRHPETPREFLGIVHEATKETERKYPNHEYAIHQKCI